MKARRVELERVFSRHAQADLAAAYQVLVPHYRARTGAGPGQSTDKRTGDDHGGDLCQGVLAAAAEGPHDRVADRRAASARRVAAA
jgi:hypothetical protein